MKRILIAAFWLTSVFANASEYSCAGLDKPTENIKINSEQPKVIGTLKGSPVILGETEGVNIGSKTITEFNGLQTVEPEGYVYMKVQHGNNIIGASGKKSGSVTLMNNNSLVSCTALKHLK